MQRLVRVCQTNGSRVSGTKQTARHVLQVPDEAFSAGRLGEQTEMTWTPVTTFEKSIAGGVTQETYSPRFVAYLARFLVNYDRYIIVPCV